MRDPVPRMAPPARGWPPPTIWPRLGVLSLHAVWQLAHARLLFGRLGVREIEQRNPRGPVSAQAGGEVATALPAGSPQALQLAWIGYVLPRVAARVPWRSDCLVQALAGQNWLRRAGLASRIVIGVEQPEHGKLASHAWLECAGIIVTGGEIDRYTVIAGR